MTQRAMTLADVDAVVAVEAQAYPFPWSRGNFVDSLLAGHLAPLRLDEAGAVQAYALAMPGVEEMHLLNLTTAPAQQRRGHARALLGGLLDECRARHLRKLWLEVRGSNAAALALYAACGFTTQHVRRGYYPAGRGAREDAVVMVRALDGQAQHALD